MKIAARRKNRIAFFSALLACTICCALCAVFGFKATAEQNQRSSSELKASYVIGDKVEIPDKELSSNGQTARATYKVVAPSGKVYLSKEFTVSEMGLYKVIYEAEIDGETVTEEDSFRVNTSLFTVKGKGDFEYKANEKTPSTFGMNVDLSEGSSITYNKIIDLSKISSTTDIIKLYVVPETIGKCDFQVLTITLTDVKDSTNKIMITGTNVTDGYHDGIWDYEYSKYYCYLKAGAINQTLSGLRSGADHLFVGGTYGTDSICSFCGLGFGPLESQIFSFQMDYAERKILKGNNLVVDLDDPKYFNDLWEGFTTGEAYLSVSLSAKGSFVITEIAGQRLDEAMSFYDEVAPEISVDTGSYDLSDLPEGVIQNKYKLFDYKAKDVYSDVKVEKKVYYDYDGAKEEILVTDDCFIPQKAGGYRVVYEATDWCGNSASAYYDIVVNKGIKPILATIAEDGSILAKTGVATKIATIDYRGGYGDLKMSAKVFDPDGKEVELRDEYFCPMKTGAYTVRYEITDYHEQVKIKEYTVNVTKNNLPVIIDDVVLPKYIFNEKNYILPVLYGYVFTDDGYEKQAAKVYVTDQNGEREITGTYCAATATGEEVRVKYVLSNAAGSAEKTYISTGLVVLEQGKVDLGKYFVLSGDISTNVSANDVSLKARENDAGFEFANALLAHGFSISFTLKDSSAREVRFTLTDSEDADKKAEIVLRKTTGNSVAVIGGKANELSCDLFGTGESCLISFDNLNKAFCIRTSKDDQEKIYKIGDDFEGFTSCKVYFSTTFSDISDETSISLSNLSGQNLKDSKSDIVKPIIAINKEIVGVKYAVGDVVGTVTAAACDVIEPTTTLTLSVVNPDGEYVKALDGTLLKGVSADKEYRFLIEKYGNYTVAYDVIDGTGLQTPFHKNTYFYVVAATDVDAPSIVLKNDIVNTGALGDKIYVPEATVTDNVDEKVDVYCYVITPDGKLNALDRTQYDGFYANREGKWVIRYVAYDRVGNMTLRDYEIVIGGKQ